MERAGDYLIRATAYEGRVRAFALDATAVVAELRERHDTYPAVTAALGRTSIGALLLGAMLKEDRHLVTLRVQGDGPAGTLLASANGAGGVRGLVQNPRPETEQAVDGKLNVAGVVGRSGRLTVTRDLGLREPYASTIELVSGEIGEDLAAYFARSEQVPSAVGIGVFVRTDGSVEAAGGYLVQLMPGVDEARVAAIEAAVRSLPHPTAMLREGVTPEGMLERVFAEGYDVLERRPVRFDCPCSRDRVERALVLMGEEELREMRAANHEAGTEVVCQFCGERYRFAAEEIEALIRDAR